MKYDGMFAFAGLWEKWKDRTTGEVLRTYTILTTDPNELMEPIHNRMPVIIPPKDYERWMAPTDPARLPVDLLRPYPAEEMKAWKVGKAVGNTRNNDASLVEPLKENAVSTQHPATFRMTRTTDRDIPFAPPMECLQVNELPDKPDWVYELKLDGFRGQAIRD